MTNAETLSDQQVNDEKGQNESLEQAQRQLVDGAHEAYKSITFESKNNRMANTVAEISSNLAARSLDINEPEQQQAVHDAFLAMSKEAGAKFAPAFTETGRPLA